MFGNMQNMMSMFGGMFSMLKGGSNPEAMVNMMCQGNPKMAQAFEEAKKFVQGKSEEELKQQFEAGCSEFGLDMSTVKQQFGI